MRIDTCVSPFFGKSSFEFDLKARLCRFDVSIELNRRRGFFVRLLGVRLFESLANAISDNDIENECVLYVHNYFRNMIFLFAIC